MHSMKISVQNDQNDYTACTGKLRNVIWFRVVKRVRFVAVSQLSYGTRISTGDHGGEIIVQQAIPGARLQRVYYIYRTLSE